MKFLKMKTVTSRLVILSFVNIAHHTSASGMKHYQIYACVYIMKMLDLCQKEYGLFIFIFLNYSSDFVKMITCEESVQSCYYQTYDHYGSLKKLHNIIEDLGNNLEEEITFFQWMKDETNIFAKQKLCLKLKMQLGN